MAEFRAGRSAQAEARFGQLLRRQPHHPEALLMLGLITGRSGRQAVAIPLLRQAVLLQPAAADARLLLASFLRETGASAEAIAVLQDGVRLQPRNALLRNDLGLALLYAHRVDEAVRYFEQAIALDPKFAIANYNMACALERQRRFAEAAAAYRRCLGLQPDLAEGHSRLGNLLHAQGLRAEALACFGRAAAVAPRTTLGRLNRAKLLMEEGRPADAEAELRDLLRRDPRSSEAQRLLGNTLRESGRFGEAIICLEAALALDPNQVSAWHDLVHSRKLTDTDQSLVERMEARLSAPGLTEHEQVILHFALGKALDDMKAFPRAIVHFDAGNSLERSGLSFDRERFANWVDAAIERYDAAYFAEQSGRGPASERPLLIIGMPRSGTTLVEQIVSSHPAVAAGGELEFWNRRAAALGSSVTEGVSASELTTLAADYEAVLHGIAPDAPRVTDKNPFNFLWAGLIHFALPRARFVHCRRHPIDTCLSIYFTRFAVRQEFAYDREELVFYYRQYERLMAHWRSVLPSRNLLELSYEALVANPEAESRKLIAFCGLEWDEACLLPERNRRVLRTASMWQARQPVYQAAVARWHSYEPWLGALRELL